MSERPIDIWRRKLEHLQKAEAMASDPAQQFTIREQIKDTQRQIASLESGLSADDPGVPPRTDTPARPEIPHAEQRFTADKFDVFLSHNSQNKLAIRQLKQFLLGYQIAVWFDEDELQPGMPWQDLLEKGIRNSASVAVVIGKDGLGPWEDEEMKAALQLAVKDKRPVIPVLLPGAPSQPELPMFLGNRTWVDFRSGFTAEPLERVTPGQKLAARLVLGKCRRRRK